MELKKLEEYGINPN